MPRLAAAMLFACIALCAAAGDAGPLADDPALEARVFALAGQLRCLVCQNQTIADSNADLAVDLRQQIREQLRQGADERQVLDFMVARYGDFVLYRPPFKAATALLWIGPFALLTLGIFVLGRALRQRHAEPAPAGLSEAEVLRARQLLAGGAAPAVDESLP